MDLDHLTVLFSQLQSSVELLIRKVQVIGKHFKKELFLLTVENGVQKGGSKEMIINSNRVSDILSCIKKKKPNNIGINFNHKRENLNAEKHFIINSIYDIIFF